MDEIRMDDISTDGMDIDNAVFEQPHKPSAPRLQKPQEQQEPRQASMRELLELAERQAIAEAAENRKKTRDTILRVVFAAIILLLLYSIISGVIRYHSHLVGIRDPIQGPSEGGTSFTIGKNLYHVNYLYSYDIEGLVVSTHGYHSTSWFDKACPKDVGITWGKVAESAKKANIRFAQSNRMLYVSWEYTNEYSTVFDSDTEIMSCVSNNHLVSEKFYIRSKISRIRKGDHIRIKGYLISLNCDGETLWSSTVRDDTGMKANNEGSCEIIYVTDVRWLP